MLTQSYFSLYCRRRWLVRTKSTRCHGKQWGASKLDFDVSYERSQKRSKTSAHVAGKNKMLFIVDGESLSTPTSSIEMKIGNQLVCILIVAPMWMSCMKLVSHLTCILNKPLWGMMWLFHEAPCIRYVRWRPSLSSLRKIKRTVLFLLFVFIWFRLHCWLS